MTTPNYVKLQLEADDTPEEPQFLFEIQGKKFELPKMGPDTLPAGLFAVAASQYADDNSKVGAFLQELYDYKPDLGKTLRRLPLGWTKALIEQWTEFSNFDPKAQTS